jgi:hypothetical protein
LEQRTFAAAIEANYAEAVSSFKSEADVLERMSFMAVFFIETFILNW